MLKKGVPTSSLSGHTELTNDVALGNGQVDWPALLRASQKVGVKYYFIEDESPTVVKQVPRSLQFLETLKYSSIVFGLFHFSNLFGNWDDVASVVAGVIAATTLGLGWGYMVIRTNSIVPAVVLHYVVDVILYNELFIDPLASDDSTAIVYVAFAVLYPLLTIVFTRRLFKNRQPHRTANDYSGS